MISKNRFSVREVANFARFLGDLKKKVVGSGHAKFSVSWADLQHYKKTYVRFCTKLHYRNTLCELELIITKCYKYIPKHLTWKSIRTGNELFTDRHLPTTDLDKEAFTKLLYQISIFYDLSFLRNFIFELGKCLSHCCQLKSHFFLKLCLR